METQELTFTHLEQVLEEMGEDARNTYRNQLAQGGKNTQERNLFNSVTAEVRKEGRIYFVGLNLLDYWKYVEGGSKGTESSPKGAKGRAHFPPTKAIARWLEIKPVVPRPYNGKLPSTKSLAFMVARKIYRHGIEPFPALASTKAQTVEEWRDRLQEAFAQDIGEHVGEVLQLI